MIIIGGGVAGMEAASVLTASGHSVAIIEKEKETGGHIRQWAHLFPTNRPADEVYAILFQKLPAEVMIKKDIGISAIQRMGDNFEVKLKDSSRINGEAILITTGFSLFNARKKEEYGYDIYDNVITSADLEKRFKTVKDIRTDRGKIPAKIGIVHCVGSRDVKTGNTYCSAICCITGIKQAIELKKRLPRSEVYNFYMDLRLHGNRFEALYREAQERWGVHFIRGRLSEASETQNGALRIKAEDTLVGKPLVVTVDMLVLMVGMEPAEDSEVIGKMLGIERNDDRFFQPVDEHTAVNRTNVCGAFVAGACTGPKSIRETLTDARAAAWEIDRYLRGKASENVYSNTVLHERMGI